jgi:prepilin-type N-terminal cleavage/methylation domain-containing protein
MNCRTTTTRMKKCSGNFRRRWLAFTLIEMLLVITIIAVMASIGIPHLKGWGESNAMTAATRQLMDDLSLARLKAINSRATVYVIFVPPDIVKPNYLKPQDFNSGTNLYSGQYTTYALFTKRQVGEQPGRENPRYLTPWKSLPEKVFISAAKFNWPRTSALRFSNTYSDTNRPFFKPDLIDDAHKLPFPKATNTPVSVPYLAFNSQGQLISEDENPSGTHQYHDTVIPLARGSIFYARDANGVPILGRADAVETPPLNSISNYNNIRIDWLTGRARVERKEMQ